MSVKLTLIENIKDKLGTIDVKHSLTDQDIEKCMTDTVREMQISIESIEVESDVELYFELRSVYYALSRIRNSNLENFEYSTASDGTSIDKTSVSKQIGSVMKEIDDRFLSWLSEFKSKSAVASGGSSSVWTIPQRTKTTLSGM